MKGKEEVKEIREVKEVKKEKVPEPETPLSDKLQLFVNETYLNTYIKRK